MYVMKDTGYQRNLTHNLYLSDAVINHMYFKYWPVMILVYFQFYDTPVELVNHWTFLFRLKKHNIVILKS